MKKILMIATGGTIASKGTADGLAPELTSQDILHYIPSLKDICEVETLQLCNLDSTTSSMAHGMQGPIFWIVLSMHPQMMPAVFRLSFPEKLFWEQEPEKSGQRVFRLLQVLIIQVLQ